MSSRIRSRSLCSRLSRQGFPCSWCGLGAVLLFVMAYPPVAETSSEEIPVLFSTTSQEHTPFTFLQESGQNRPARRLREILKSQVDLTPPFGGGHRRSNIVLISCHCHSLPLLRESPRLRPLRNLILQFAVVRSRIGGEGCGGGTSV